MKNLPLIVKKDEPRIDSRLLAQSFGREHRAQIALIDKHLHRFKSFGKVLFQKAPSGGSATGQRERYALLNESQCYLLLTFTRNTDLIADLKVNLVRAFEEARLAAELKAEYLPAYRDMHDQLIRFHDGSSKDRFLHMNINKLVNAAAHIKAGHRSTAPVPHKAMLIVAQHLASEAMRNATDKHEAYAAVKSAVAPLSAMPLIGG